MSYPLTNRQRERVLQQDIVRIWSFQTEESRASADRRGFWAGCEEASRGKDGDYELFQHDWMRMQMAKRLPDYSGEFPVWAYLRRPNLRQTQWFDSPTLLLVADVPRERLLVSNYEWWVYTLNHWYMSLTEAEDDEYDRRHAVSYHGHGIHRVTQEMLDSWERVFRTDPLTDPEQIAWRGYSTHNDLQACVDRIFPHEVVSLRPVTGRLGRNHTT